ncbi:hypothetical protein SDC9_54981 [bioreactor metagenome]|uniref:Uncharacterized protein n=1 Tax=bioreactor metagenome TaxID=1076179 RepID=A0A644WY90_9ZZZZ
MILLIETHPVFPYIEQAVTGFVAAVSVPSQHSLDSQHQLLGREWLGNVVISTQLETQDAVALLGAGCHEDHRTIGFLLQLLHKRKAIAVGQHHILNQQGRDLGCKRLAGALQIGKPTYGIAGELQVLAHPLTNHLVILNDINKLFDLLFLVCHSLILTFTSRLAGSTLAGEPVSIPAHRLDPLRTKRPHFRPHVLHMGIDDSIVRLEAIVEAVLQNLGPGDENSTVAHQITHNPPLCSSKGNLPSIDTEHVRHLIKLQNRIAKRPGRTTAERRDADIDPSKQGMHPEHKLLRTERLADIVVRTQFEAQNPVALSHPSRHKNHRKGV